MSATPGGWRAAWAATWKTLLFLVVWAALMAPFTFALDHWLGDELAGPVGQLLANSVGLAAMVAAAWLLVVRIDRRPLSETGLSRRVWVRGSAVGIVFGLALTALAAAPLVALGRLEIRPAEAVPAGLFALAAIGVWVNALLQELLFRGVLLTLLERHLGLRAAVGISTALFVLAHGPALTAAGWLPALSLLTAGLLLAAAFLATRELFFVTGLHWGWNAAQGLILGIPVSGHAFEPSLFTSKLADGRLAGGEFGLEGGLAGVGATAAGLAVLLVVLRRRRRLFETTSSRTAS